MLRISCWAGEAFNHQSYSSTSIPGLLLRRPQLLQQPVHLHVLLDQRLNVSIFSTSPGSVLTVIEWMLLATV